MYVKVYYVRCRAQPTLHQCVVIWAGEGTKVCVGGNRREVALSTLWETCTQLVCTKCFIHVTFLFFTHAHII